MLMSSMLVSVSIIMRGAVSLLLNDPPTQRDQAWFIVKLMHTGQPTNAKNLPDLVQFMIFDARNCIALIQRDNASMMVRVIGKIKQNSQ